MNEPVRLLAGGGSAYERSLLESADLDVMPSATPERLARALAAPAALGAPGPGERAGSTRWASRRWVRLGAVGGLGGLGLVAALLAGNPGAPEAASSGAPTSVTSAPLPSAAPERAAPKSAAPEITPPARAPAPVESPPSVAQSNADTTRARARSRSVAATPRAQRPTVSPAPAADGLLEEVRLLERVRAALHAGRSGDARRLLEEYRARFAHGELAFEAELLEAERANADGDGARARQLARQLLARPGAARYRPRLVRLLRAEPARGDGSLGASPDMDEQRSNP